MINKHDVELTVIAIDDEPLALARLVLLLNELDKVRIIGTLNDPEEGLALVEKHRPDIVLLDIEMPVLNGLQVAGRLRLLEGPSPFLIFVTAFDHHAINAFEAHAIDYVLKPVVPSRLEAAVERIRELIHNRQASRRVRELERCVEEMRDDPERASDERDRQEIWALRGSEFVQLRIGEIERVESDRDYVHIHNAERAYLLRATLGALHERLGADRYIRIRRSAIVRLDRIGAIRDRGYGDLQIRLQSGTVMQVGRTYLKPVRARLRKWARDEDAMRRLDSETGFAADSMAEAGRWP